MPWSRQRSLESEQGRLAADKAFRIIRCQQERVLARSSVQLASEKFCGTSAVRSLTTEAATELGPALKERSCLKPTLSSLPTHGTSGGRANASGVWEQERGETFPSLLKLSR